MLATFRDTLAWIADAVTQFTLANAAWAPGIIFLLAFAESLAIISFVVPATVILVALGAVIQIGGLPLLPQLLAAITGAFLGDWVSYLLGSWFKQPLLGSWPLNRMTETVAKAERLFARYGWLTYFVGRFFGPMRAVFPLFAGIMQMNRRRFLAVNAASAICWATLILGGGALLGAGFLRIREWL
jgi:membrane protein DedA with SNARE-associated domain